MPKCKLTKRKDGRYRKVVNGVTFYGHSEREINSKILEFREKKELGPTFTEVADEWWREAYETLANQSIKVYRPALERAKEHFSVTRVKDIEPRHVSAFFRELGRQGYAYKTVANQRIVINQIFNLAVINGDIIYNPCASVHVPKGLKKTQREPASEADELLIHNSSHPWLFPIISLMTGLRKGEILALQWKDIDFENKTISVTKSVEHLGDRPHIKAPKTAAGVRLVPLLDILAEKLLPHRKAPEHFIISDTGEKPLTNRRYQTLYREYKEAVGIDCTSHQLRHSYATIAIEEDVGIKELQGALGHTSISMTLDTYAKNRKRAVEKVASKLNARYSKAFGNDEKTP